MSERKTLKILPGYVIVHQGGFPLAGFTQGIHVYPTLDSAQHVADAFNAAPGLEAMKTLKVHAVELHVMDYKDT